MGASQNTDHKRPEQSLRYGPVEAAIWRNHGENGDFLNTTFTRHYRQGDDWKQTDSFREQDLPTLSKLAADAHTAIQTMKRDRNPGEDEG